MGNKKNMEYTPIKYLKDFVVIELVIIYFTLMIGDVVHKIIEDESRILSRFIPIGIITLISSFLIIRFKSKKCKKSEEQNVKRNNLIAPVIVAVVLLIYGFYSVHTNLKVVRENLEQQTTLYSLVYGEEETEALIEETLETAEKEAKNSWIISSVIYLVAAEAVVFITNKKLNVWLKDDMVMNPAFDPAMQYNNMGAVNYENNYMGTVNSGNDQSNTQGVNNINWNL